MAENRMVALLPVNKLLLATATSLHSVRRTCSTLLLHGTMLSTLLVRRSLSARKGLDVPSSSRWCAAAVGNNSTCQSPIAASFRTRMLSTTPLSVSLHPLSSGQSFGPVSFSRQAQQHGSVFSEMPHYKLPSSRIFRCQTYVTRAHPKPIPEYAVIEAVEEILKDATERNTRRRRKWDKNHSKDLESTTKTFRETDETIELAINLNLDPRKPGQQLRGSIALPHGSGKSINCLVFTSNAELKEAITKTPQNSTSSEVLCGGEDLVEKVASGEVPLETFQRSLATSDMVPQLKKIARLLGPRGLMPNAKDGTLLTGSDGDANVEELVNVLEMQMAGKEVVYRTDQEGIVHVAVGKASFGSEKLLDNIGQVMKDLVDAKPENYGKQKKKKSGGGGKKKSTSAAKYLLRATVSSTQGKGMRLDLRTVDPASAFFLSQVETSAAAGRPVAEAQAA